MKGMEKIELAIKVPRAYYDLVIERCEDPVLSNAFKNGTVLPKGHGQLKDADVMINKLCTQEASELFGSTTCAEILDFINDEKPIIEADKVESKN